MFEEFVRLSFIVMILLRFTFAKTGEINVGQKTEHEVLNVWR